MGSRTQASFIFALPFDHTLFVDSDLVNYKKEIKIEDINAQFELPGEKEEDSLGLKIPSSCSLKMTEYLPEKMWGLMKEGHNNILVEACCIVVPVQTEVPFKLSENQVEGNDFLIKKISDWFDSFTHWIWVLTTQSLNPVYPDPKVIHRKSKNIISFLSTNGESSIPRIQSPPLKMIMSIKGPESEKMVNSEVLDFALDSTGTTPPLAFELLASARMAARRGDLRRALVDAGTASELSLAKVLDLDENHRFTLGALVNKAIKRGIDIPTDTKELFVDRRNDAIHRGKITSGKSLSRALEISETIVTLGVQGLIPFSSLKSIFRPYTHNITIIQPSDSNC